MVTFTPVDIGSLSTERLGRRGRVSYPLLKSFLEANVHCAEVNLTGLEKNPQYLRSVLFSYIRSKKLPIKIFSLQGKMYLMRLDMTPEGVINPDWKWEETPTEGAEGHLRDLTPAPINAQEVELRFRQEKDQFTK